MKLNLKLVTIFIIAILLLSSIYIVYFTIGKNVDKDSPSIDDITGDAVGKNGDIITILVKFSDNIKVTKATFHYKKINDAEWTTESILSGRFDIQLDDNEDFQYYVTIDDAAGNGPVGNPSTDGSIFYNIVVIDENNNDEEYTRNVFLEEASFTTCTYCPIVAGMLYDLYTSGNYNFYYVTLIRTNEKAVDRLDNEYNLFGLPSVFVDGGYKVLMGGTHEKSEYAQAIREAEIRIAPDIQIKVTAEYDNNTNKLLSNVFLKNNENEKYDGLLRVYLTEKVSRWSGPEGQPYHFGFLDYIRKNEIHLDAGENSTYDDEMELSDLDPENLMVIAVVFNSEKKQGYSDPPANKFPFDAYYADAVEGSELIEGGNLPPTVGFSLPEIGMIHFLGKSIFESKLIKKTVLIGKTKIIANAEDDSGVEKVEFYINGILVGKDTEEPFEYSFRKVKLLKRFIRKYTISVIAYDSEGKTGNSSIEVIGFWL
ncbi:hypothetical protein AYK20_02415 [Thermoplasmatales archaeon SG8-52-1]|nr:MAG: hypothetical protein AYK20_02415 [Thermoplasmatales archaeon SG8-52-1]